MNHAARPGAETSVSATVPDIESLKQRLDAVDYLADDGAGFAPHIPALDGDGLLLKVVAAMSTSFNSQPLSFDPFPDGRRSNHGSGSR